MDTTVEGQGHLVPEPDFVPEPNVSHQQDLDINQDDDFDFELGGDGSFDLTGDADSENVDVMNHDATEAHYDQTYLYQSQEHDAHTSVTEQYNGADFEQSNEHSDVAPLDLSSLAETVEPVQTAQNDAEPDQDDAGQEEMGKSFENGFDEETYYDETAGNAENLDKTGQPQSTLDHDIMDAATSVDYVPDGDVFQENTHEADENEADTAETPQNDEKLSPEAQIGVPESDHKVEHFSSVGTYESTTHRDAASGLADVEEAGTGDDALGAELAKQDASGEAIDASLDQCNWAEDYEDGDDQVSAGPIVTVSYRGQEYSMFAQSSEDNSDTYFLEDVDSIHRPLSQFLRNLREVVASELEAGQELLMRIDGLGLEFGESTAKDFLDHTTLAQIIEVNDKLVRNDGGSQHAEVYIFLSVQSDPLQRFQELVNGAEEGHGLSHFEQYYEPSGDASVFDDQEQFGDVDFVEESYIEPEEAADGSGDPDEAEQDDDPLQADEQQADEQQADEQQQTLDEALPFKTSSTAAQASEENELVVALDSNPFATVDTGTHADITHGVGADSLQVIAMELQTTSDDNSTGNATPTAHRVDTAEMPAQVTYDSHDDDVNSQVEKEVMDPEEAAQEQTEVQIDNLEEGYDRTDDCYQFDLGLEAKVDQTTSAVLSSPVSPDFFSNAFTDAEWNAIMTDLPGADNPATDMQNQDYAANMANDENYLDLGDEGVDHASTDKATINGSSADHLDTQRQISTVSSATGTLNGEETSQGDEASANEYSTLDLEQAPSERIVAQDSQIEDDEIDWNHDEDDEIGVVDQNPTDLSPSSLSVKRSRQEDEIIDGLGDDTAAKRRRT